MQRRTSSHASAARTLIAAALLSCIACSSESGPPMVGSPTGSGGNAGQATQSGAGAPAADGGGGGMSAPGGGAGGAGGSAVQCKIPDTLPVTGLDAAAGAPSTCRDIPRTIFAEECSGTICHYKGPDRRAGLDLMSPCVTDRLVGAYSTTCAPKLLIDPQNPDASFILDKLSHDIPACGARMPLGGKLPDAKISCVNAWVHSVAQVAH